MPGLPVLGNTLNLSNTITMPQFLAASRWQYEPVFTLSAPGMRITALVGPEANVFASREGHRILRSREAWRPNDRELGTEKIHDQRGRRDSPRVPAGAGRGRSTVLSSRRRCRCPVPWSPKTSRRCGRGTHTVSN
ncbi:hypothetical protein ACFSR9_11330 [Deinococcus taklimakanensis]|uniref:Uncharacterized protein n=1 Tax=Deinococcus taklimakanensis TaxID=536443 RepID=A0ABW5P3Y4_9DEIO